MILETISKKKKEIIEQLSSLPFSLLFSDGFCSDSRREPVQPAKRKSLTSKSLNADAAAFQSSRILFWERLARAKNV